jgi:aspartyl-tRNA(Asn)/glutamyl-tRNA(Gln) amidotransferase subunit C
VAISAEQVREVAALARLRLEPGDAERFAAQLGGILDHMDGLRTLDLADVPPFATAVGAAPPARRDSPGADALLLPPAAFAPAWKEGFFTVPRLAAQRGPGADVGAGEGSGP